MTGYYQDNTGILTNSNTRDSKKWKMAITLVGQGYESTERCHDYKTSTGTTYGGRGQLIDIGRSNNNFKDGKPKCFNYNKYRHLAKDC